MRVSHRAVIAAALPLFLIAGISGCAPDRGEFPAATPTASSGTEIPSPEQSSSDPAGEPTGEPTDTASADPTEEPTDAAFDKDARSIDDPASYWVIVNKLRPLDPKDYAADDLVSVPVAHVYAPMLRQKASDAVVKMFADFEDETGETMQSQSAYRSYSSQVSVYNGWVSQLGKDGADLTSARPGYSEHQTGLAIDISATSGECTLAACFGDTAQGKWLKKNAWEYGFVLRYPKGQTDITGYEYEPWHYRFVGKELAAEMHDTGTKTLEEFFDLPAAPDYE